MAETSYDYSVAADIVAGKVDVSRLASEIRSSSILTALERIDLTGGALSVVFKAALSAPDRNILDGTTSPANPASLIGAHSGAPWVLPPPTKADGTPVVYLDAPRTSDGKQIVLPNLFPGGVTLYFAGAGDGAGYGDGQQFTASSDVVGDTVVEWSFNDWQYLAGGGLMWQGAVLGDWISLEAYCPATPITANGGGTGNANLVDPGVGAAILIVPAAGNGAYDLDLATANLVPADQDDDGIGTGFFTWDKPDTGRGTVTAGAPGASLFHLFSTPIPLARFVNRFPALGDGRQDITVPAIKIKRMLPHWTFKVTIHNTGHAGLKMAWYTTGGRVKTL